MITINGTEKEYVLDLNQSFDTEYALNVNSYYDNIFLNWDVSFMNGNGFSYTINSIDSLLITIDNLDEFKNESFLILKNNMKETVLLRIIPNKEAIKEKVYTFKVGKIINSKPNEIQINVTSKMNGKSQPWVVEYWGKPYMLDVSYSNTKLNIISKEREDFEYTFLIIISQEKSKNKINISLKHNSNGIIEII